MKCVRFLIDHCEPMVKDNAGLFKTTISTLINLMIYAPGSNKMTICTDKEISETGCCEELPIDSSSTSSEDTKTCNGGGVDN